jgi:ABC-type tungstate transport system permease subunit
LNVVQGVDAKKTNIILSTTTSTQDSGLLDVLIPLFEKQTGYAVKTVSVGTGQALALAAKGDADVALVHAPSLEKQYVAEGKLLNRRLVMYNDFVIIGPKNDPAKIKSTKTALAAVKLIELAVLVEGDKSLLNVYSVLEVNPTNGPRINVAGGKTFADFMVSPRAQAAIGSFGAEKFGQPLFVPVAGKREDELGV